MVVAAAVVVLASCGGDDGGDDGGLSAEPLQLDLEAGECFDRPDSPDVTAVPAVRCREPHDLEVFAVVELPDGPFPGQTPVAEQAGQACRQPFAAYVGAPPDSTGYVIVPYPPDLQAWEAGNREVVCAVGLADEQLDRSVAGSEAG
jgi:hypothetical protein